MRLPSLPPLPIGAFIVKYLTIKLNSLTDNLNHDTRTIAQRLQTPNYTLRTQQDIIPLSRILRNSRLSRGLHALVSDTLHNIIDHASHPPAQIARHKGIKVAYEVALDNMELARHALIRLLEMQLGIEYQEGIIGDPAEIGMDLYLLRQAMFGEVTEEEQRLVVERWVAKAQREFVELGGRERMLYQDVDVDALIAGPARS